MARCFFGKPPFNPFEAEFAGFVFFHIVVLFPPRLPLPRRAHAGGVSLGAGSFLPFFFIFFFFFKSAEKGKKKEVYFRLLGLQRLSPPSGGKDYVMCSRYFVNGAQPCDSPSLDRRGRQGKEKEKNKKKIKTTTQ